MKKAYEALIQKIQEHDYHYYVEHRPLISDQSYDLLFKELEQMEKEHPELISDTSPTRRVALDISKGFSQKPHPTPMYSLANTYNSEELFDFEKRACKILGRNVSGYFVELKMDGIALSLHYVDGILKTALTRGDGKKGDDVTANVRTIKSVPLQLLGKDYPKDFWVRAEVYMSKQTFAKLSGDFANPRNAAGGSLKLLDAKECAKRHLSIMAYGIAEPILETQEEVRNKLKSWGFPAFDIARFCPSMEEVVQFAKEIEKERPSLDYEIDGIVIKVNQLKDHKLLGQTERAPRYAVAYKFAATQAATRIHAITVQVGRTGVLTPVAELDPVFVAGSTISRATLHNAEEIERKGIRVGDRVLIEKGGDVIPKVVEVVEHEIGSKPWIMPKTCPACGSNVIKREEDVAFRCPNTDGCLALRSRKLAFFASKSAMDISDLGPKVVDQLLAANLITKPSDLYALTKEDLTGLEGFKKKSIDNLLGAIEKSKDVELWRFIHGLSIPFVGEKVAEVLAEYAESVQHLIESSLEELEALEGVGQKIAQSVIDYFSRQENIEEVMELLERGVKPRKPEKRQVDESNPFFGNTFVLTGTLEGFTRDQATLLIKERGGKVSGSVSKATDYLLMGQESGSKEKKARELGVTLLTEAEFNKML